MMKRAPVNGSSGSLGAAIARLRCGGSPCHHQDVIASAAKRSAAIGNRTLHEIATSSLRSSR
jgi:hypothetical protein